MLKQTIPQGGTMRSGPQTYLPPWWNNTILVQNIPSPKVGRYDPASKHIFPHGGTI
ncbi:MAG: hypothetical protein LBH04_07775 [Tannerellaceae bacterium]|nr:hypothetical protein [Tannerellaceae bacterium]